MTAARERRLTRFIGRRGGWAVWAALWLGVALLGAVVIGSSVTNIGTEYIGFDGGPGNGFFYGDTFELIYHWWASIHQLSEGANPYADQLSFGGVVDQVPNQFGWPFSPIFVALMAVGGIPFASNVVLLLTFPLAGGATYLWLRAAGLDRAPALVGGLVVAFFPPRIIRLQGHYVAWLVFLVPLALWTVERAARAGSRKAQTWWSIAFVAALLTIVQAGELYFVLFATLVTVSYALLRLGIRPLRERPLLIILAGIAVAFAVVVVVRWWLVSDSFWAGGRPLIEAQIYSPNRTGFWTRDATVGSEHFVYLGVIGLAAIPLGLLAGWRRKLTWFWVGWGIAIGFFALGTNTHLFVQLHENTSFLGFARSVTRPLPIAACGLGLLAALATQWFLDCQPTTWRRIAAPLVVAAIAIAVVVDAKEVRFGTWSVDGLSAQHELLKGRDGGVISTPVFDAANTTGVSYMYASMLDPRPNANGYSPYTPRAAVEGQRVLRPLDCGILGRDQRAALARGDIRFVVQYPMFYGTPWSFWSSTFGAAVFDRAPGATPVGDYQGVRAWEIAAANGPAPTLAPVDLGAAAPAQQVAPCTGWASPDAEGVWSQGGDGYLWAIRMPGTPEPRITIESGPIANTVRYGGVDGAQRSVRFQGTKTISLPIPADGRWTPVVLSPAESWSLYGKGPERRGIRLRYPLPPTPVAPAAG